MSIIKNQLKSKFGLKGETPGSNSSTNILSKLHNLDSLGKSKLDLDARTPDKYLDNQPS